MHGRGFGLGYMVLPWELVEPATDIKTMLNNGQPWLDQAIVAISSRKGHFANHLRRIRRTYRTRRDCLVKALREHGEVKLTDWKAKCTSCGIFLKTFRKPKKYLGSEGSRCRNLFPARRRRLLPCRRYDRTDRHDRLFFSNGL